MANSALSPLVMLATSMHSQPGVYALLLGSGVSTGAGVPTGWGVVRELVRRVATAAENSDRDSVALASDDPEAWWAQHGSGDLGYGSLLQALASTPAARQGLLREFFEPKPVDMDNGVKAPSAAHMAVAQLVKSGMVRVVLTTNFDRLTEQALEGAGVSPQVIARPESVAGMAPLAHSPATVIKLHGDFLDLGTRNTPAELDDYPEQWTTLLRQVFDEYGLLISGWSAEWDTALVRALESTPNRRYPLYWDSRSSGGSTARALLSNRAGTVIPAGGADELFGQLARSLEALADMAQSPLTTAMATAQLKRCLPNPLRRIEMHDLLMDAVGPVVSAIAAQPVTGSVTGDRMEQLWRTNLSTTGALAQLLITGVRHDDAGEHDMLWLEVVQRLVDAGTAKLTSWTEEYGQARLWPALLATAAVGLTAVRRGRDDLLIAVNTEVTGRGGAGAEAPSPAALLLHPDYLLAKSWIDRMPRWGANFNGWQYPGSHLLKADLRAWFDELVPLETDWEELFFGWEYRLGLIQCQEDRTNSTGPHRGEFVSNYRWGYDGDTVVPLAELSFTADQAKSLNAPWPHYLGEMNSAIAAFREILRNYRSSY